MSHPPGIHLLAARFAPIPADQRDRYPFSVPLIAGLAGQQLDVATPMTIVIGENGSGKSTLLEALACAIGSITVGSQQADRDGSLHAAQLLARTMRLSWTVRTRRGFFMRSEDFFGYARQMKQSLDEMVAQLAALDADTSLTTMQRNLARLPYAREVGALRRSYGESLDAYSHGESFFTLFRSRFVPNGLYILDEPEAPLSPMRQLALISLLKESIANKGSQFIISTHSPILMAFPDARIYSCDNGALHQVHYDDIEHVTIMRDFLANPAAFLKHL